MAVTLVVANRSMVVGVAVSLPLGVGVDVGGSGVSGGTHNWFESAEAQLLCSSQALTLALYHFPVVTSRKDTVPEDGLDALL